MMLHQDIKDTELYFNLSGYYHRRLPGGSTFLIDVPDNPECNGRLKQFIRSFGKKLIEMG